MSQKFKKGDQVVVISGSEKKKTGEILFISKNKAIVSGVNMIKNNSKKAVNSKKPFKDQRPIHVSNISHIQQ